MNITIALSNSKLLILHRYPRFSGSLQQEHYYKCIYTGGDVAVKCDASVLQWLLKSSHQTTTSTFKGQQHPHPRHVFRLAIRHRYRA